MNRIDELIAEYCPSGVEFNALGDIAVTVPGLTGKTKADFSNGNARYVSYKNAFANLAVDQSAGDFVSLGATERQNRLRLGDVVITGSSESLDEVGLSSVVVTEPNEPLYLNSFCFALRFTDPTLLSPDFSKYLLRADSVRTQIRRSASGVTRINISKPRFMKVRIPVPPLEVQREIVRILDQFTALEAELEAELEARRRQYEHYRHDLLAFGDEVPRVLMGELLDLRSGRFVAASEIAPEQDVDRPYPCYGGNGLRGYVSKSSHTGTRVLVGRQGALSGNVHRVQGEFYATEHAVVVTPLSDARVDIGWAFHMLTAMSLNQYVSRGAQPGLAVGTLKALSMPMIPLDIQREIAALLDKFDALVNDLSVGLPAELAARRKQYEYYRDRLLTFEESSA